MIKYYIIKKLKFAVIIILIDQAKTLSNFPAVIRSNFCKHKAQLSRLKLHSGASFGLVQESMGFHEKILTLEKVAKIYIISLPKTRKNPN